MRSDEQLVGEVLSGRPEAYGKLVLRHERAVRAAAWSVLGDHHAAEDIAQEAFLAAYRKLSGLRRGGAFAGWVCRIARRRALRAARRQQRSPKNLADPPDVPADAPPGDDESLRLLAAVMTLPPRLRTLVLMTYFEQRSAGEIAAMQNCPVGTVTKLLSRARQRLARQLQERP